MALTALNIARCIIAMARNRSPGFIGSGEPIGWTVLTPITSQSTMTLAEAVVDPASAATSASVQHLPIIVSSRCTLRLRALSPR
jgi:hypothetical protein